MSVPILHASLPFALAVREAFFRERPDCIAVELPETLGAVVECAVLRFPQISVLRYPADTSHDTFLVVEPCDGVFEALRLGQERGIPTHLIDRDGAHDERTRDVVPDPYAIDRIGYAPYAAHVGGALQQLAPSAGEELRERTMAYHLSRLRARYSTILFVCGLAHGQRVERMLDDNLPRPLGRTQRSDVTLLHLHPDSAREVLGEPGYVQTKWEGWRTSHPEGIPPVEQTDRYTLWRHLLLAARDRMVREDGERVAAGPLALAMRFARNQALVRGALAPDLVEITVAARGVASDDFAWHVFDEGVSYAQDATASIPIYRLTLEELDRSSRHFWLRRRKKTRPHLLRLVRGRPKESVPGEFVPPRNAPYLCSYPPEDLRIEAYGAFLKRRAKGLLAAERARVAPFLTTLADGMDVRETIRNRTRDGRIYVREEQPVRGEVGAICVIFDADDRADKYSWTMTWQGENADESDMALYATPPGAHPIGPRIGRCEYGGFLMTSPPGRMFRVFEDPYFAQARSKSERLLAAAIDYAQDRWIVYVAPQVPPRHLTAFASRAGKKVFYVPIGQLSPQTLRKIRVFHVLDGKQVRKYAHQYVHDS